MIRTGGLGATKRRYGLDWPREVDDVFIDLKLWKAWREYPHASLLNPVEDHLFRACRRLFTPDQLVIHPWMETMAHSWTYDEFAIWWGCAGSGKSHALGLFVLLDYLVDPDCTFSLLASTTKEMLEIRSFASVVSYLNILKANREFAVPLKYVRQSMSVIPEGVDDDASFNVKCRIKGVAVQQGTTEEARANLQGVHTKYVRLVLDELAAMRPAAMEARHNLSQCTDFKVVGATNPESIYDQAGVFSTPRDGWGSVNLETADWESNFGRVYRFDAYKSPGLTQPDVYPFLPTQRTIDRIVASNNGNEDAPSVWTFLRAFPPPQSLDRTVLTESEVKSYDMAGSVVWKDRIVRIAALDPAFTSDGDDAPLVFGTVGVDVNNTTVLLYEKAVMLEISASDPRPVLEQIVTQVVSLCGAEGVPAWYLGVDDSGTQNVADALTTAMNGQVVRFNFAAKPPDLPTSEANPASAATKYKNTIAWLYYLLKEFGSRGQVRGLFPDAAEQLCKRRVLAKTPLQLEAKKVMKTRLKGRSPDVGDACAMLAGVARTVIGMVPGGGLPGTRYDAPLAVVDRAFVEKFNNMDLTSARYGVF